MRIEWREQLSVGNEAIDDDHKHLLCILNGVDVVRRRKPKRAFLLAFLDEMRTYTEEHFGREERLLFEVGYPRFEEHKKSHQLLLNEFNLVCKQVEALGEEEDASSVAFDLIKFLQSWLINHIIREDKEFAPYLRQARSGRTGG
jgi:hemerythrin